MNKTPLLVACLFLFSSLAGCFGGGHEHHDFNGIEYDPAWPAPDFTLTDQNGQSVSLSDFEDKVVVLAFTYTACPDVCLTIEANLHYVNEQLSDESDLVILSITIDPTRDTPEHLLEWTSARGYDWPHLTSDNPEDFTNDDMPPTGVWDVYNLLVLNEHINSDHSDHSDHGDHSSHSDMSHQVAVLYPDNTTALLDGHHDMLPEENASGWNLTETTMSMNNVSLNYSVHEQYGHAINGINDIDAPGWPDWYWSLHIWNATNETWELSQVGIDEVMIMQDTDHVAWAASNANLSYLPAPGSDMVCYNMGTHGTTNHTQQIDCETAGYMWVENQGPPSDDDSHDHDGMNSGDEETYEVGHNTVTFIIDKNGKKRLLFKGSDWSTSDFIEDLEYLLHEDTGDSGTSDDHSNHNH